MNKAEKSLRWVVNQIPDFKPTTNEEKMLLAIKFYSEAGAEEISRLEAENAALHEQVIKEFSDKLLERTSNTVAHEYGRGFKDCLKIVKQIIEEMTGEARNGCNI